MATHRVVLTGHLTSDALAFALDPVTAALADGAEIALLVDAREMSGYDTDARELFVRWNRQHKARITQVAILTGNWLWRAVVAAMSLASGQKMRAFQTPDEAQHWIA